MTVTLSDVVDPATVAELIESGYVRERSHPDDPALRILNYTEKTQYERAWSATTQACRGLILRGEHVVGRPWSKFFNYGEHPDGSLDLTAPVEITDKLDGSLGILYEGPDGWAIATRGSFASEQALHATAILRERYLPGRDWWPSPGYTYLFEIVYPDNRIVVNYGSLDDLLLLGVVNIDTGVAAGPDSVFEWPGSCTQTFPAASLADALALPPRPNAEGVVARFIDTGLMVKIKQDDYVRLHRIVTGLNERAVWEHLAEHDGTIHGLLAVVPDEFHGWVHEKATALAHQHAFIQHAALDAHDRILADLSGAHMTRKDYALAVRAQAPKYAPYLFQILDGKDPSPAIWKSLRPVGQTASLLNHGEDVA